MCGGVQPKENSSQPELEKKYFILETNGWPSSRNTDSGHLRIDVWMWQWFCNKGFNNRVFITKTMTQDTF